MATVLIVLTVLRGLFATVIELSPDEAYYWTWSQKLAPGYFDHPPAIAFFIWIGTSIFGDTALGVRCGALFCSALSGWILFVISRQYLGNIRQAFWATVIVNLTPLWSVGAVINTPDAPLLLTWLIAIWAAMRAQRTNRISDWALLGLAIGLAAYSKMTGWCFLISLVLFCVAWQWGRQLLFTPAPVVVLLCVAGVVGPNLIWNAQHGWVAFTFQARHGTNGASLSVLSGLEFLGGQIGVVSPLLWGGLVAFMAAGWRRSIRFGRPDAFLLWCLSTPMFLGFAILAWFHKVEANWPAVAYLAAIPTMVWTFSGGIWFLKHLRIWATLAGVLAGIMSLIIHIQVLCPFLPIEPDKDPTQRLHGWAEFASEVSTDADTLGLSLAAEGYGLVSELRFYTGQAVVYEPTEARLSQYDLWPMPPLPERVLFIQPKNSKGVPRICRHAKDRWQLDKDPYQGAARRKDFVYWVCEGLAGR
jgi:4-amino-4-deoxy-L-arabinose transferase-like glycosyltransferase